MLQVALCEKENTMLNFSKYLNLLECKGESIRNILSTMLLTLCLRAWDMYMLVCTYAHNACYEEIILFPSKFFVLSSSNSCHTVSNISR